MADGRILIDTKIDLKGAEQGIGSLESKLKTTAKNAEKIGKNMSKYVTAPIMALGGVAFAAANDIEKAYNNIAISSGAVGDDLEDLKSTFIEVFSAVPDSADAASNALANLNTLTGATDENLRNLTIAILDASRTLGEDGVANSVAFGKAMKQWKIPTKDGTRELDKLYKLTQDYGVGLGEISSQLTAYGAIMNNAGFAMDETAHLFASLTSEGLSISRIMPALNSAFRNWASEGKNSRDELQKMIDVIKETEDSQEALAIATETFGAQGAQRLMTAIRNDTIPALSELGSYFEGTAGLIQDTSNATKTVGDRMAELKNQAQIGLEPLGAILVNIAQDFLPPLIEHVQRFAEWMQNLDPKVLKVAAGIGAVLAVIGPLLMFVSAIIPALSTLGAVFGFLFSPIGLIIGAIAALVAGIVYLWNTNEAFRDAVIAIWEWIKDMAMQIFDAILAFWDEWGEEIISFFRGVWELISSIFLAAFEIIKALVITIFGFIQDFWDKWGADIMAFFRATFGILQTVFTTVFDAIWTFIQFVFGEIKSFWDKWGETIVETFTNIFEIVRMIVSFFVDFVMAVIKTTFGWIQSFWNTWGDLIIGYFTYLFDLVMAIFKGAWDAIKVIIETAIGLISNIIKFFLSVFKGDWAEAWEAVKGMFSSVWDGIVGILKAAANTMIGIANAIIGAFEKMLNFVGNAINKIPSFTVPSWVPGIGGSSFGLPKIPTVSLPRIPSLDVGTNFVDRDGLAFLHRGEAVVPKKYNPAAGGAGGSVTIENINVYAQDGTDAGNKIAAVLRRMKI